MSILYCFQDCIFRVDPFVTVKVILVMILLLQYQYLHVLTVDLPN